MSCRGPLPHPFEVLHARLSGAVVKDGNYVDAAERHAELVVTAPCRCQPVKSRQFGNTHGFKGMPVGQGFSRFHFGDDQRVAVKRHDIDFALGTAPVAVHDPHAL